MTYQVNDTSSINSRNSKTCIIGRELGEIGLRWLKIHIVNMYGQLKRESNATRLNYAEDHLDDIVDSANNPFEGAFSALIKTKIKEANGGFKRMNHCRL